MANLKLWATCWGDEEMRPRHGAPNGLRELEFPSGVSSNTGIMKWYALIPLFLALPSFAADERSSTPAAPAPAPQVASEPAASEPAPADWPRRRFKLRLGQVHRNADTAVQGPWEHDPGGSPQYSAGLFWNFPRSWHKVRFFLGAEYKYLISRAELSGSGKSSIETTFHQLLAAWGLELRPLWARPFGFTFALNSEVWGEKSSKFKSSGFSEDLGRRTTNDTATEMFLVVPSILEVAAFWEITPNWKLALSSDARSNGGNALTLGVDYVF